MNLLHESIKKDLGTVLQAGLKSLGAETDLANLYNLLSPAPSPEMGQLAFPLFSFAKALRSAPQKLATDLAAALPATGWIKTATAAGPYLNFVLDTAKWTADVLQPILKGDYFKQPLTQDTPRTMIEYSQPNTHKEMHVGHMRNLALGDALIRMHRYCGYDIVSATFPGDVGAHVAKTLWYMKFVNKDKVPVENKGEWLGELYVKATKLLDEIKGTEAEAPATAKRTEILQQLEAGTGEYYDLWRETRQWSIDLMEHAYDWADVKFDAWYWESDVDAASMAYAREMYEKGVLTESQGAIGMDLTDVDPNLGFAMFIKRDGTGLYLTKDVELARRKFEEWRIESNIYVVDMRQAHHFRQVFGVLKKMGFQQAENCYHLQYDYVEGKEGMFSSRLGNAVPLFKLISQMELVTYTKHLAGPVNKGELDQADARKIAVVVSKGAIKYGMVRIDPNKKITFDMDEWTEISGDSGPYQQYTFARIQSLLAKQGYDPQGPLDPAALDDPREQELLVKAAQFNDVVLAATHVYRPNMLTSYLYEFAKVYNNLNNSVILRDIADPVVRNTKLHLHKMVGLVIQQGMALLGIEVPNRM
jgi:arginyl-tRNA synthetase